MCGVCVVGEWAGVFRLQAWTGCRIAGFQDWIGVVMGFSFSFSVFGFSYVFLVFIFFEVEVFAGIFFLCFGGHVSRFEFGQTIDGIKRETKRREREERKRRSHIQL